MNSLLVLVAVVVGVAAIIQLIRLNEITSKGVEGNSDEVITKQENDFMAYGWLIFMVIFFGGVIWGISKYGYGGLGKAASVHGEDLDWLLNLNYMIILPGFFITNALLFGFAFKYRYDKYRRATYFSHSNKLELLWTIAPSIVLAVIIIMGLKTWVNIMFTAPEEGNPMVVEAYAEQFGWSFRLSGENNTLGEADYKLICGEVDYIDADGKESTLKGGNPLGVISKNAVLAKYTEIDASLAKLNEELENANYHGDMATSYLTDEEITEKLESIEVLNTLKYRIQSGIEGKLPSNDSADFGKDDVYLTDALYLIKGRPVTFQFRSKDVIHSAWFPHFRAQMNCVPGHPTNFTFTPKYTTKEFANDPEVQKHYANINEIHNDRLKSLGEETEKVDFNFILLCNKICGAGHHNMQKNIVVVTEEEYELWYECTDWDGDAVTPRLDINGNAVVFKAWSKEAQENGLANETNAAEVNAAVKS